MANNRYYITKISNNQKVNLDCNKINGFDVTPKNRIKYDGIVVDKLVIIKQAFVQKILKKKIKRKLELYLKFIVNFIESDSESGDTLREVLNDITRYKQIISYKYRKHLGDKYIELLLRKIEVLEKEIKVKIYLIDEKQNNLSDGIGQRSR